MKIKIDIGTRGTLKEFKKSYQRKFLEKYGYKAYGHVTPFGSFVVLAASETEAWELIKDRIASNKNQFLDDEFANDIRKYSISSIDLNDAAPQVIEDWKR